MSARDRNQRSRGSREGSRGRGTHAALPSALALLWVASCASTPEPAPDTAAQAAKPAAAAQVATVPAVVDGPPLALMAATATRDRLLGEITIPSIDRAAANAAGLATRAAPMPVAGPQLRDMMYAQMGLPTAVTGAIDNNAAVGIAVVSREPGTEPGLALALGALDDKAAQRAIGDLGKTFARRGTAVGLETPTGQKLWAMVRGKVLLIGDDDRALEVGGEAALAARRELGEDAVAVVYPDAIARHNKTDVKQGLAEGVAGIRSLQQQLGAGNLALGDAMDRLTARLADAQRIEFGLRLDPTRGASLATRLVARPGSVLEAEARAITPVTFEGSLIAGEGVFGLWGWATGPTLRHGVETFRTKLGKGTTAGHKKAGALVDAFLRATEGRFAGALRMDGKLGATMVFDLKSDAAAAELGKALAGLGGDGATALVTSQTEILGVGAPSVTAKAEKAGSVRAVHGTIAPAGGKEAAAKLRPVVGEDRVDLWAAVVGRRLVVAGGANAKKQLTDVAGKSAGKPGKTVAEALDIAKGREGVLVLDLGPLLKLAAIVEPDDPRFGAMSRAIASAPLVVSWGGDGKGPVTTFELAIPVASFAAIGAGAMAMSGASPN